MNEPVEFGGFILRRCDVYRALVQDGWEAKMADKYAFGYAQRAVAGDPISIEEMIEEIRLVGT